MSNNKMEEGEGEPKKVEVQSVEEDDEFEEFPLQDWQAKENADDDEVCWGLNFCLSSCSSTLFYCRIFSKML